MHCFSYRSEQYALDGENFQCLPHPSPAACDQATSVPRAISDDGEQKTGLTTLTLLVAQACNMSCSYCYAAGGEYGGRSRMTIEVAEAAVDFLIRNRGQNEDLNLTFFGGEPLLAFPLIQQTTSYALARASRAGVHVSFSITTNGSLLDNSIIDFFARHSFNVMVSFDGSRAIHDSQRTFRDGRPTYDAILPKLKQLLQRLPLSPCRATLTSEKHKAREVREALHAIGFQRTAIAYASGSLFGDITQKASLNREEQVAILEEDTDRFISSVKARDESAGFSDSAIAAYAMQFLRQEKATTPCGAGIRLVAVNAAGAIFLCHRFVDVPQFQIGTVFDDTFQDPKLLKPIKTLSPCTSCFAKYLCGGACYHHSLTTTGAFYAAPADICSVMMKITELVGVISTKLDAEDRIFLLKSQGPSQELRDLF